MKYAMTRPPIIIKKVSAKLNNITFRIELPANGFLPKASTVAPVVFPNEEKPIVKVTKTTAIANK